MLLGGYSQVKPQVSTKLGNLSLMFAVDWQQAEITYSPSYNRRYTALAQAQKQAYTLCVVCIRLQSRRSFILDNFVALTIPNNLCCALESWLDVELERQRERIGSISESVGINLNLFARGVAFLANGECPKNVGDGDVE